LLSVITSCPLVITPAETVLTYQTASAVAIKVFTGTMEKIYLQQIR